MEQDGLADLSLVSQGCAEPVRHRILPRCLVKLFLFDGMDFDSLNLFTRSGFSRGLFPLGPWWWIGWSGGNHD